LGGGCVAFLAILSPLVLGNGYEVIVALFSGDYLFSTLLLLCGLKLLATGISVGSGAVGGMFTPALLVGASWGGACGLWFNSLGLVTVSPWLFAALGMAAMLSAMSRAPVMAIIMLLEMTLNSSLLLPLMLVTTVATLLATRCNVGVNYPLVNTHFSKSIAKFSFDQARIADVLIAGATLLPEDNVEKALRLCSIKRERYVYVINQQQQFLGVVSVHNLTQQLLNMQVTLDSAVSTLLETDFPVVYQNQTLQEGWQAFTRVTLERLPVLNNPTDKQLVGALTKTSLLQQASHFF
jgi:chloride channel protein, CIC family